MAKDKAAVTGLQVSHEMLRLIAEIDEFKGGSEALADYRLILSEEPLQVFDSTFFSSDLVRKEFYLTNRLYRSNKAFYLCI